MGKTFNENPYILLENERFLGITPKRQVVSPRFPGDIFYTRSHRLRCRAEHQSVEVFEKENEI
jgi:hypothetical protein